MKMILAKEILGVLDNEEEPLPKRLKIADNAFKSSELPLQHKAFLIEWVLRNSNGVHKDTWASLNGWLKSNFFKEISRNEIDNKEVKCIIELTTNKLSGFQELDDEIAWLIQNSVLLMVENRTFQQFFKFNVSPYCQLISCILEKVQSAIYVKEFLKNNTIFKYVIMAEGFLGNFLDICFPTLAKCLVKFGENEMLVQVSNVVQKCVFYNNRRSFTTFIDQFFEVDDQEKQPVPKTLFKQLLKIYKLNVDVAKSQYKLLFHAFCIAYDSDFEIIYKFFITIIHMIGFDLTEKFIVHKASKLEIPKNELSLVKSQEIILQLLEVLNEAKNDLKCEIKGVSFSEFLKNLLIKFLYFNAPSRTSYKVFKVTFAIDPTILQPITEQVIIYAMLANNSRQKEEYDEFIIGVFDIYSKLHRTENLVSKMVGILNQGFTGTIENVEETYVFRGQRDDETFIMKDDEFKSEDIVTENILQTFSRCIVTLASWQVINVFKTLLYSLNKVIETIQEISNDNVKYCIYVEILSDLIGTFLSSIRVAEHTVAANVVDKTIKCLDELQGILKQFGAALLKREHNHTLMRSFLNIAHQWAEIHIILRYYSIKNDVRMEKKSSLDNFSSCDVTYLHPYLSVKEWCLISERINNFGGQPCKQLLQKLYMQQVRAQFIFEEKVSDEIISNLLKNIATHLEYNWRNILENKFFVNDLLPRMDSSIVLILAKKLTNNINNFENTQSQQHIFNSPIILNAINYVTLTRINKQLARVKRKHDSDSVRKPLSSKIYSVFTEELFLHEGNYEAVIEKVKVLYNSDGHTDESFNSTINEDKIFDCTEVLKKCPIVYSSAAAQKVYIVYLFSLHKDLCFEFARGNFKKIEANVEDIIIGALQQCSYKLADVFKIDQLCMEILKRFTQWEETFVLVTDNVFKYEESVIRYEPLVWKVTENLLEETYMRSSIIIMNAVNKLKKSRLPKEVKNIAEKYKAEICDKIVQVVAENSPQNSLLIGYAYALTNFLSHNDNEKLSKLFVYLDIYVKYALENNNYDNGFLMLFTTILQNKSKIPSLEDNITLKIWNVCKDNVAHFCKFEEFSQLIVLIIGHIPNEEFSVVLTDLLNISESSIDAKDFALFIKHSKTWESILSCNLNPVKIKVLQGVLENLLRNVIVLLDNSKYDKDLFESVLNLQKTIVQTHHLHLTPALMDMLILTVTLIMPKGEKDFKNIYDLSLSMLSGLLRYRKPFVMDRLPPYLQQYRIILRSLCKKSDSDLEAEDSVPKQVADCAHQLEKLTKNLVVFQKDMGRIAMYLIGDILEQYEQVTIYPNVKIHLNNCIYSLISICDQHAVAYLMRVLSSASTEIFKVMYENYKKYYRFTGKV